MSALLFAALLAILPLSGAWATDDGAFQATVDTGSKVPKELQTAGIREKLGEQLDLSIPLRDETGATVPLASYFHSKKPVLLTFVYFECPNLCSVLLNGILSSLKNLDWTAGQQFEILTVSIDPREKPPLAAAKKANYLARYGRTGAGSGWHFLTGDEAQLRKLAGQAGFGYSWDETQKQFAHSAGIFVLTPEGKISRLLFGIEFTPKDLKVAMLEAANGKVGTIVDRILLFCYHYDPNSRSYSLYVTRLMQAGAAMTVLLFGGWLALFWRRQRRVSEIDSKAPIAGIQGGGTHV